MSSVLLTVRGPRRSVDLAVPEEVPLGELLPSLLELCGEPPDDAEEWTVSEGDRPLPPARTLAEAMIQDGAVVQLTPPRRRRDGAAAAPTPEQPAPRAVAAPSGAAAQPSVVDMRVRALGALIERLVGDAARIAAGDRPPLPYMLPTAAMALAAVLAPAARRPAPDFGDEARIRVRWDLDDLTAPVHADLWLRTRHRDGSVGDLVLELTIDAAITTILDVTPRTAAR